MRRRRRRRNNSGLSKGDGDEASITESLMRTRAMLESEVDRIGIVTETIEDDRRAMSRTSEGYGVLKGLSSSARGILRSLENAKVKEQVALWVATVFYVCCVVYVLATRLSGFCSYFKGLFW